MNLLKAIVVLLAAAVPAGAASAYRVGPTISTATGRMSETTAGSYSVAAASVTVSTPVITLNGGASQIQIFATNPSLSMKELTGGATSYLAVASGASNWFYNTNAGDVILRASNSKRVVVGVDDLTGAATAQLVITSTGIGINTATPVAKLDVNSGSNAYAIRAIANGGAIAVNAVDNSDAGGGAFVGYSTSNVAPAMTVHSFQYYGGLFYNVQDAGSDADNADNIGLVSQSNYSNSFYAQQGGAPGSPGDTMGRNNVYPAAYVTRVIGNLNGYDFTAPLFRIEDLSRASGHMMDIKNDNGPSGNSTQIMAIARDGSATFGGPYIASGTFVVRSTETVSSAHKIFSVHRASNNTRVFSVDNNAQVAIGDIVPGTLLDMKGAGGSSAWVRTDTSNALTGSGHLLRVNGTDVWGIGINNSLTDGRTLEIYNAITGSLAMSVSTASVVNVTYGITASTVTASSYVQFASKSKAQLLAITPTAVGQNYYCNNCSPLKNVVSTGTSAGNFADQVGGEFK